MPPYDATVVERLERAGAVIVGKTNCDEFAMGSSNENSAFGPVRNPWDTDRTPGGSSGGSAVAVAGGLVPAALGSDTGGSIRQPAALCGIVGLKPTYGRVSRYGLIAFASSLDQIGPLTRTAADAATLLGVLAGPDPRDATAVAQDVPDYDGGTHRGRVRTAHRRAAIAARRWRRPGRADGLRRGPARVGGQRRYRSSTWSCRTPVTRFPSITWSRPRKPAPTWPATTACAMATATPDARTLHSMYFRTRDEAFGPEVKRRIMLGTYVLSAGYYDAYYLKAQQVRTLIRRDYERAFADVDVVAMPTSPTPPFRLGEKTDDPLQMYLADVFTVSANLSGLPAISIPCGMSAECLPIGLQFTGRAFDEATLLRAADAFERATDWWKRRPPTP